MNCGMEMTRIDMYDPELTNPIIAGYHCDMCETDVSSVEYDVDRYNEISLSNPLPYIIR
jgi:hypothetical protein